MLGSWTNLDHRRNSRLFFFGQVMDNGDYFRRSGSNFTTNIMITAIVCLFFVVAVMVALHMYARYVFRRQERRREALRQAVIANAAVQSNDSQPRTGLDAGVIATLPIFIYSKGVDDVHIECSVCLSNLEEGEMARLLPNCKHTFHSQCIDTWLRAQSTCPICRTEATPRPQSMPIGVGLVAPPTAPPVHSSEGTSDGAGQSSKTVGSSSRLSSFRRMLSRDRSSHRVQPNDQADTVRDLEAQ